MSQELHTLSGLYYPFSRCINVASMKQMFLVFDQLVFLDPVDDEEWRAILFKELELQEDPRFERYRSVYDVLPTLIEEGAIGKIAPANCSYLEDATTTAAALSDLMDPAWLKVASNPQKFRMPHRTLAQDKSPTWQMFLQKMPGSFVSALQTEPEFRKHLFMEGGTHASWTLSYSAGSAAGINVHLAAAEEFGLAPVTDSEMHHQLLLMKLARSASDPEKTKPIPDDVAQQLSHKVAISLLSQILPQDALNSIPFEDILTFRDKTRENRKHLVNDINSRISLLTRVPSAEDLGHAAREVQNSLENSSLDYLNFDK
jgi:hypothetical protein